MAQTCRAYRSTPCCRVGGRARTGQWAYIRSIARCCAGARIWYRLNELHAKGVIVTGPG